MSENKKKTQVDTVKELNDLVTLIREDFEIIKSAKPERDEMGRIIIYDPNEIPKDMDEDQVRKFWNTHAMSEELLEASWLDEDELDELPRPRKQSNTKSITLRIEIDLLKRLQKVAEIKEVPYQTLLKQFLTERVYEEEKREKVL